MTQQFHTSILKALEFMAIHPGGRNRRLTAEERDGTPWVSVAMNFDSRIDAEEWCMAHLNKELEREGVNYSEILGYYKAEFPWGLVYAHFQKIL